jgi:hypothetical protein
VVTEVEEAIGASQLFPLHPAFHGRFGERIESVRRQFQVALRAVELEDAVGSSGRLGVQGVDQTKPEKSQGVTIADELTATRQAVSCFHCVDDSTHFKPTGLRCFWDGPGRTGEG